MEPSNADKFIDYIATLDVAQADDYTSHQAYADVLLRTMADNVTDNHLPEPDDLWQILSPTIRRQNWYEAAVLRDLGILRSENEYDPQFIKNWFFQAHVLQGQPVPYHALLAIAYEWQAADTNRYKVFQPHTLPTPDQRPEPPEPDWQRPDIRESFDLHFTNYYMACHEPDLLSYNIPLLKDMYPNETPDAFDQRIRRYITATAECKAACTSLRRSLSLG